MKIFNFTKKKESIKLSDHFTYKKLIKFVLPSIVMMVFTSIYGVVDGFFVSNYVGKVPFAAVNLIMPFLMIFGSIGFMIGAGGSAIVSQALGRGENDSANRYFSMLIYISIISGIALTVVGVAFIRPISILLGAEGELIEYCVVYGRIILFSLTPYMLQNIFQSFLITAEKPVLGLAITLASGFTNMFLDYLLVAVFPLGVAGAAYATAASQILGGIAPLIYFAFKNSSLLRLTKTGFYGKVLLKTVTNGSSELMTNLSMSIVTMLYNYQLIRVAEEMNIPKENAISAYGAIMYVGFIFASIFIGYSIGCAPIVGYSYGSGNTSELKNMFKKSVLLISLFGVSMVVLAEALSVPLAKMFVGYDKDLLELTIHAFMLYSISYIFTGFNIFGSAFFTALGNGGVSAAISFLRTLVFQVFSVLLLPVFFKTDGIWCAVILAEFLALLVTATFIVLYRKKYKYM